jgi:cytochrome b561
LVGVAALGQISLGWWMLSLPKAPPGLRAGWFNVHKSIGITIGLIMVIRLIVRMRSDAPGYPGQMPKWQQQAARLAHALFYFCLFALPLSGYLGSSFTRYPIKFYGFALPHWGWDAPALKDLCSTFHLACVGLLMALVTLHVLAALKHLLVDRDGVFFHIWPRAAREPGD